MESLLDFASQEWYKRVSELGVKVAEFDTWIEWERFFPILGDLYTNTTDQGWRPNFDEILMVKVLVLQFIIGTIVLLVLVWRQFIRKREKGERGL